MWQSPEAENSCSGNPDAGPAQIIVCGGADLLAEDGLLAPLLVLRALIGVPGGLQPVEVRNRVAGLAEQHPSRLIRKEATRLLAEQEPPTEG